MAIPEPGERLLAQVERLKEEYDSAQKEEGVFNFTKEDFEVEVTVKPHVELGISLRQTNSGKPELFYDIDTDLYKLDDPENREPIDAVESEIVDVLSAFHEQKIVKGTRKGRNAFAIPLTNEFVLVCPALFSVSSHRYKSYDELKSKGKFLEATQQQQS